MSVAAPDDEHHVAAGDRREPSGGERLRAAREAAGLSIPQVSTRLHLDSRTVDALERGDYASLPAPTFVRGYLRAYARLVGIDADSIVRDFDQCGLAPPDLIPDIGDQSQARSGDLPVRMVTYVIVAGLAILVALWWQNRETGRTLAPVTASTEPAAIAVAPVTPPPPVVAPAEAPASATTAAEAPAESTGSTAAVTEPRPAEGGEIAGTTTAEEGAVAEPGFEGTPGESVATEQPAAEPATSDQTGTAASTAGTEEPNVATAEPAAAATPAENQQAEVGAVNAPSPGEASLATPAPAAEGSDRLLIGLEHESWIEVYDADGARLFYNLAHEGSELTLEGRSPFRVLLGNARDVHVAYNGVDFDPTPYISRGIARFVLGGPHAPTGPEQLEASPPPAPPEPAAASEPAATSEPATTGGPPAASE